MNGHTEVAQLLRDAIGSASGSEVVTGTGTQI